MRPSLPFSSVSSAAVGVVIGFGGTVALVVQAGQALGASPSQIVSMLAALTLGIGIPGALLSWRMKMPIVLAWSTPGAALLAATTAGYSWPTAIGAFVTAALLMVVTGLVPVFGRLAARIPSGIASGMLAGVLLPFCMKLFQVAQADLPMIIGLFGVYLTMRRFWPVWSLPVVLGVAFAVLMMRGQLGLPQGTGLFGHLEPVMPRFELTAAIGLAVPLYLVTLASQNLPGLVVLRTAGYEPAANRLIFWTGLGSLIAAPFGGHGVNLAAITAAICTSEEAHPDARQRWKVGVVYGLIYVVVALFAAPLAGLFIGMPAHVLAVITGLALLAPLGGSLSTMMASSHEREAAILTFAATASGMALFGIGAAFWGLVIGTIARMVMKRR
ncbi:MULTISPECIES: benzoate/H(+) symporter BenE family transporter [unclassified Brevundimonas]|uniref:benzoate/H(+) symporter BenE family transporter n=1 Tax=unclassified Brevundimonas TaxID=2622653 RepID=UPI0025B8D852|nr:MULTISPECIES: benzoate/H(+) symporter BenE family transporter [unclassified Brevundimonas]